MGCGPGIVMQLVKKARQRVDDFHLGKARPFLSTRGLDDGTLVVRSTGTTSPYVDLDGQSKLTVTNAMGTMVESAIMEYGW